VKALSETIARSTRSKAIPTRRFAQPVPRTSLDRPEKIAGRHMKLVELLPGRR